ncbi:MAG: FAD-binding monooxygenase, partial [Acidimicrobiia bacterium]
PYGPGWALVGDAGYNKDQGTAIGMTHAFRDAQLLCGALNDWFSDERSFDNALGAYHRTRDEDSLAYYDFVCMLAEMNPPRLEELQLLAALKRNPAAFDRFLGVFGDLVPVPEFFAPEHLGQIMQAAAGLTIDEPIFKDFDVKVKDYALNPFAGTENPPRGSERDT